jgi:hypothetical protein
MVTRGEGSIVNVASMAGAIGLTGGAAHTPVSPQPERDLLMTISWYAVTVDCTDARKVAAFWSAATGWAIAEHDSSAEHVVLRPGGALPQLAFNTVPEPKPSKTTSTADRGNIGAMGSRRGPDRSS